jgi:hypothetical protein
MHKSNNFICVSCVVTSYCETGGNKLNLSKNLLNLSSQHSVCLKAQAYNSGDKVYLVFQEVYFYNNVYIIIIILIEKGKSIYVTGCGGP